jgi:uncharacterized protein YcsI (UPF0317 family)
MMGCSLATALRKIKLGLPGSPLAGDGALAGEPTEIGAVWRDDLVAFVLACSFTFEELLLQAGIALRHLDHGCNVSMYHTTTFGPGPGTGRVP